MITISNVNKWYGDYRALTDINAEVKKGEVVVVCGPSGSGKSTLIRTVNRLEEIKSGELYFDGQNVHAPMSSSELNHLRSRIGFVFQSFNLFPHLSVLENIMLSPMRVLGVKRVEAKARAAQLLERVHALDDGRLAAARGAADHHHLALLDLGRTVGEDLEGAVPLADVLDGDHRMMAILV